MFFPFWQALKYLIRLMCSPEERVRRYVVFALAYLSSPSDHETVFIHNHGNKCFIKFSLLFSHSLYSDYIFKQDAAKSSGLELLLAILQSQSPILKREASMALSILARRANFISSPPPTSQVFFSLFMCTTFVYFDLFSLFTESFILPYLNCSV